MAGDGRSTDDITLPLLFLFHKEGNILLEALKEYREVEVLLSDKARDRGATFFLLFYPNPPLMTIGGPVSLSLPMRLITSLCSYVSTD